MNSESYSEDISFKFYSGLLRGLIDAPGRYYTVISDTRKWHTMVVTSLLRMSRNTRY